MKFSIITYVFNNKKTLECAIESVYNQRNAEVEYIIIDGGFKYGGKGLIKNLELRIRNSKSYFEKKKEQSCIIEL